MPVTRACPLCGGELTNPGFRLHRNIVFCDSGAITLGPTELTIFKALLHNPGGMDKAQLAERAGILPRYVWPIGVNRLGSKLADIGWTVVNVGCGGRGGATYVIKRKQ